MPTAAEPLPLRGFTVGVTATRKADELIAMLRRKGATVLHGPSMRSVDMVDDTRLRAATETILARLPDVVLVTTGVGFRGWLRTAAHWGTEAELLAALGHARLLVRGPKAKGAVRAAGLREEYAAPSETTPELLDYLRQGGVDGLRIAVQRHGEPLPGLVSALRQAGARVTEIAVYRWLPPLDPALLDTLITAVLAGRVDALAFTSAPAVAGMLARAGDTGRGEGLRHALGGVLLACVGQVTAAPLAELGLPVRCPERGRTGALVRLLVDELPAAR